MVNEKVNIDMVRNNKLLSSLIQFHSLTCSSFFMMRTHLWRLIYEDPSARPIYEDPNSDSNITSNINITHITLQSKYITYIPYSSSTYLLILTLNINLSLVTQSLTRRELGPLDQIRQSLASSLNTTKKSGKLRNLRIEHGHLRHESLQCDTGRIAYFIEYRCFGFVQLSGSRWCGCFDVGWGECRHGWCSVECKCCNGKNLHNDYLVLVL